jgi:hypothetical protein
MATRDEIIEATTKMVELLQDETFANKFRAKVSEAGILFANQLFDSLEEEQVSAIDSWGMAHTGERMLTHLKMAIKSYPQDEGVKMAVMTLVGAEEKLLDEIQKELAEKHGLPKGSDAPGLTGAGGAHGHSHGGAPAAGGAAGSHGHSHNGVPCNGHSHGGGGGRPGMPNMNPQQMQQMQAAMATLSPDQKKDMQGIQQKMMSGTPPNPEDQRKMQGIQQHLAAYMSTMQAMVQNAQNAAQAQVKQ